jgi:hypothetical protein
MSALTQRVTVYSEPALYKAVRLQAVETSRSISDLINEAVRVEFSADLEDIESFHARADEPTLPYEAFLQELKRNGTL